MTAGHSANEAILICSRPAFLESRDWQELHRVHLSLQIFQDWNKFGKGLQVLLEYDKDVYSMLE